MPNLHPFFASILASRYDDTLKPDPSYVEKVWHIAEKCGNVATMCDILRSDSLTPAVLDRARLRKEEDIRILYILRKDTPAETIKALLENEGRSGVFAGLVREGRENKILHDILVEKIVAKPTKILAREMVACRFPNDRAAMAALKVLAGDHKVTDAVRSSKNLLIKDLLTKEDYAAEVIESMTTEELVTAIADHRFDTREKLSADNLHKLSTKLMTTAQTMDLGHVSRHFMRYMLETFIQVAGNPKTSTDTFKMLSSIEQSTWFGKLSKMGEYATYCSRLQTVMSSSSMTLSVGASDDAYEQAKCAEGSEFESLVEVTVASGKSSSVLEGLLENPRVSTHSLIHPLLRLSSPTNLVVAMERTRSSELFKAIWRNRNIGIPTKCWEALDDAQAVVMDLSKEVYSKGPTKDAFSRGRDIEALFVFVMPEQAILDMPWDVIESNCSRYSTVLSGTMREKIMDLQMRSLGTCPEHWETFNSLAHTWQGTFGSLLQTSVKL